MNNFSSTPSRMMMAVFATAAGATALSAQAFEAKVSGHVNRLIMQVDDGVQSTMFQADNVNSQTRFRFAGTHDIRPGLTASINWEVAYTSNPSSGISMTDRSVDATFNERHAEVYLLGDWGKVSLGQGYGAANGGMEVDLSGAAVINYSGITDIGGGFAFRQGSTFGPTIGSTIGNLDFESHYDRLRYDTPSFGPFLLSARFGTKGSNDVTELAARYASGIAGGKVAATIGWSKENVGGIAGSEETFGGSVSWLHTIGINLSAAFGTSENDDPARPDRDFYYGKLGYISGNHAVSFDYGRGNDFGQGGDKADVYGVGYVFTPKKWIELYAGVKLHSLDRTAASFDDVTFVDGRHAHQVLRAR